MPAHDIAIQVSGSRLRIDCPEHTHVVFEQPAAHTKNLESHKDLVRRASDYCMTKKDACMAYQAKANKMLSDSSCSTLSSTCKLHKLQTTARRPAHISVMQDKEHDWPTQANSIKR